MKYAHRAMRTVVLSFLLCLSASAGSAFAQNAVKQLFPPPPLMPAGQTVDRHLDPPLDTTDAKPAIARSLLDMQGPQAVPPLPPEHTGLGALVHATGSDFAAFPRRKSTWVILGIGAASAALIHPLDDNLNGHAFSNGAKDFFVLGKYLGSVYVETGVAVGLYTIGRLKAPKDGTRTNKLSHLGFDLVRANIISQAFVQGIKVVAQRDRPNGNCCSFPSGHAASAFATASVLERHFGYRGAWPTMVAAAYVAMSRLADKQHFLSDVVFGSALGMATGWTVVGRHGRENFALVPVPVRGGVAVMLTRASPDAHGSN
jgi:membrane-associated phospholipid phosphatase